MTVSVFSLVLLAAALHAIWNAVIKGTGDKTIAIGLVALGHMVLGLIGAAILPLPDIKVIPFIIASTLIHWGYYYGLTTAYKFGDLSLIYPIARGISPVIVTFFAFFWIDERLSWVEMGGVLLISSGILFLGLRSLSNEKSIPALVFALTTGILIAAYSLTDGFGVRLTENPLSYIVWLFIAEGFIVFYIFVRFKVRLLKSSFSEIMLGFFAGVISTVAYGLALYAKSLAPLGIVTALRETSVIIATLIGVLWFKEKPIGYRIGAASIVFCGIIFLTL
jgi:drug/metabolite transporter (DMT)-like permease|tara:strand:+ start:502 stop:1335 length:834 start_codon:yes stop_codon:yes gene_type:complete